MDPDCWEDDICKLFALLDRDGDGEISIDNLAEGLVVIVSSLLYRHVNTCFPAVFIMFLIWR